MVRITLQVERSEADGVYALDSYDTIQISTESWDRFSRLLLGWGAGNYLLNGAEDKIRDTIQEGPPADAQAAYDLIHGQHNILT